jgi:hypothetical protein
MSVQAKAGGRALLAAMVLVCGAGLRPARAAALDAAPGAEAAQPAAVPEPPPAAQPAAPAAAAAEPAPPGNPLIPRLRLGLETKLNYRNSQHSRFAVPFNFPPDQLPVGQTRGFEETVNPGSHFEISNVTLLGDAVWSPSLAAHAKIDFINLYYRNPTSSDRKFSLTEMWIRCGRATPPATLPPGSGLYLLLGKFPKFERQNDRHLESYGLVSTAFNRFEDAGAELGVDLGRHFYVKVSETSGNPVFLRDPNALAGDNGIPAQLRPHPDPNLNSGVVILYDTHLEDVSLNHPQTGAAAGFRFADEEGRNGVELMVFGRRRTLASAVDFSGSFYRGDLRTIEGPPEVFATTGHFILPITNDKKQEVGANLWLYWGGLSLFGQVVDQKLAGLPRRGYEGEAAWKIDLPLAWSVAGQQLFTWIAPAARYSKLDNRFHNLPPTPAPSFAWNWSKIDGGLRLGILAGLDLTLEYAYNDFILVTGAHAHENELLSTLRMKI